jgi:hypothetical protein
MPNNNGLSIDRNLIRRVAIQHVSDFSRESNPGKGFLQEFDACIQHSVLNDCLENEPPDPQCVLGCAGIEGVTLLFKTEL